MHSSSLTPSWEYGIRLVSSYSCVVACYLVSMLLLECIDDLIILALFSITLDYSQIIPK